MQKGVLKPDEGAAYSFGEYAPDECVDALDVYCKIDGGDKGDENEKEDTRHARGYGGQDINEG